MSVSVTKDIALGEILRGGVSLYTREAAALVAEVCRQAFYASDPFAPAVDAIRISPDGSLTISPGPPCKGEEQMAALASLLEVVLPPLGSSEPDYAVRASLRMLAPRSRGRAGLPPVQAPETLGAALSEYAPIDANATLCGLWTRADRALHHHLSTKRDDTLVTADAVRAAAEAHQSPALTLNRPQADPFVAADEPTTVMSPERQYTTRGNHGSQLLAVLLFGAGFAGGGWLGKQAFEHSSGAKPPAVLSRPTSGPTPAPDVAVRTGSDDKRHTIPRPTAVTRATGPFAPVAVDLSGVSGPAFSPSFADGGRELVFHVGREPFARLVSARLALEGRPRSVVVFSNDGARTYHPRRSPDGQFVAFDSDRDGERAVYVARRDWSEVRRVSGPGLAALPTWSPDMKWLAFVRGEPRHSRVWNLWLRDMRIGTMRRLTNYRFGQTWNASWFPDSKRVCYSHEDRLVVLDVTTGTTFFFRSPRPGRLVRTPAIAPDGERVIFQVHKDGAWMLDLADGSMRRVLDDPSAEEFAWAPDGRRVAYHSHRDGSWRIWLMPAPV